VIVRLTPLLVAQASYRLRPPLRSLYDPLDLVNDAWLVALPRLGELTAREGRQTPTLLKFLATTLLYRINNLVRKHIRGDDGGGAPEGSDPLAQVSSDESGVVTAAVRREVRGAVLETIEELEPSDREVLLLRGIEQQPNQAVALLLNLPPQTVAKRYQRALERLRARLPGSVFEELE
jgi:RNA polymerase sigma factor (sigma-70 family)